MSHPGAPHTGSRFLKMILDQVRLEKRLASDSPPREAGARQRHSYTFDYLSGGTGRGRQRIFIAVSTQTCGRIVSSPIPPPTVTSQVASMMGSSFERTRVQRLEKLSMYILRSTSTVIEKTAVTYQTIRTGADADSNINRIERVLRAVPVLQPKQRHTQNERRFVVRVRAAEQHRCRRTRKIGYHYNKYNLLFC